MNERMDLADRLREVIDTAIGDSFSVTHERAVGADPAGDADRAEAEAVRDEVLAALLRSGDEHHTLDELYEYRMLYNALAANEWAAHGTYPVVKSWRHSDGEECFGGGWFIVVATLPTGQVSNHYAAEHWDLFAVPEVETPPEYDGHDPAEAARRMRALLSQPTPSAEPYTPEDGPAPWGYLPTDRIEDMAPGTTFDAVANVMGHRRGPFRWRVRSEDTMWSDDQGYGVRPERIDPSTIRDVTPPPVLGGAQ